MRKMVKESLSYLTLFSLFQSGCHSFIFRVIILYLNWQEFNRPTLAKSWLINERAKSRKEDIFFYFCENETRRNTGALIYVF